MYLLSLSEKDQAEYLYFNLNDTSFVRFAQISRFEWGRLKGGDVKKAINNPNILYVISERASV